MKALMSVRVLLGSMFSALILSAILSFPAMAEGDEPPSDPVPTAESDHAGEPLTEEGEEVQTMETVPAIVDNPGGTGRSEACALGYTLRHRKNRIPRCARSPK